MVETIPYPVIRSEETQLVGPETPLAAEAPAIEAVLADQESFDQAFAGLVNNIDAAYGTLGAQERNTLNTTSFDKKRGQSDNGTHREGQ